MAATPLMGVGVLELLIILLGGGGLPLNVPPRPLDYQLLRAAPAESVMLSYSSGIQSPDPTSGNATERLLAEQEIAKLVEEIDQRVQQALRQLAARENDPNLGRVAQVLPDVLKTLLVNPSLFQVNQLAIGERGPVGEASFVIRIPDGAGQFASQLKVLQDALPDLPVTETKIRDQSFSVIQVAPQQTVVWGLVDDLVVAGWGQESVERVLAQYETDVPESVASMIQEKQGVERLGSLTYTNLGTLIDLATPFVPQGGQLLGALGLDDLQTLVSRTGLDQEGFVNQVRLSTTGQRQGLMRLLDGKPLATTDVSEISADAIVAVAGTLDLESTYRILLDVMTAIEPRMAADFEEETAEGESQLGLAVRRELFACLGDTWRLWTSPSRGGLVSGWTLSVDVKDPSRLESFHSQLVGFFRGVTSRDKRAPRIQSFQHLDHQVFYLDVPNEDFMLSPAWCIAQGRLVVTLFPTALKAYLAEQNPEASLAGQACVQQAFSAGDGPRAIVYQDTRAIFDVVYPLLEVGLQVALKEVRREGIQIDASLIPSGASIRKHLRPGIAYLRVTDDAMEWVSRQTLPGGSVGSLSPLLAAAGLPAIFSARDAAKRAQATNQMKQIGLAHHNYHDALRGFPPAHSVDADGKPLLSWRVHILPYVGYAPLYNKFKLDEPWDSEHNKKLISAMPPIYAVPGIEAAEGKTTIMGVELETKSVLGSARNPVGRGANVGTRIAEITDGTSNTILGVIVNQELAIEWTRPGDFKPTKNDPTKGLATQGNTTYPVLFCDGSVRVLSAEVDRAMLWAMYTPDGREPIRFPSP